MTASAAVSSVGSAFCRAFVSVKMCRAGTAFARATKYFNVIYKICCTQFVSMCLFSNALIF